MKITKRDFKELLREQIEAVVDETKFYDLAKEQPPPHSETPYAPEEGAEDFSADVEELVSAIHTSSEDPENLVRDLLNKYGLGSQEEEELPGPGDRPAWEDDASHPDSPDYEEEEGVVDLRGIHSTMMDPMQYHSPEARRRRFEKRQGRIKESELKDMIRATLEEVLPLGTSHADAVSRSHGASGRQGAADFTYNKEGMGWKTLDQMDSTDLKRAANDLYNLIYGHLEIEAVDTYDPTEPLMMLLHALLPGKE